MAVLVVQHLGQLALVEVVQQCLLLVERPQFLELPVDLFFLAKIRLLIEVNLGQRLDSSLLTVIVNQTTRHHQLYYIKPETVETDFLRIAKPEDIKVCDPACGSGHMLTYAFDLL